MITTALICTIVLFMSMLCLCAVLDEAARALRKKAKRPLRTSAPLKNAAAPRA